MVDDLYWYNSRAGDLTGYLADAPPSWTVETEICRVVLLLGTFLLYFLPEKANDELHTAL